MNESNADILTVKVKLTPKIEKLMKKFYGKNLSREIAVGRKLVKTMQDKYKSEI